MRFLLAAFALALIGVIFSFAPSTSPAADASCNPGRSSSWGNYQVGWDRVVTGVEGVKSEIKEYDPYVSHIGAYSGAWVMLETNSGSEWAQAGWRKSVYGREKFAQWTVAPFDYYWDTAAPNPVGSSTQYMVFYSGGIFYFYANGRQFVSPVWATFTPAKAYIAGEITNLASQMPGGYNRGSEEWLYTSYYRGSDHVWRAYDSGYPPNAEWKWQPEWTIVYFGLFQWNWWDLDIWDRACYD